MRSLRPQGTYMLDILLGMDQFDVLVSHNTVNSAQIFDHRMGGVEFLLQGTHDEFYTLRPLGVLAFALMLGHAGVVDQACLGWFYHLIKLQIF